MATSIANISWNFVAGSTGTLVEYRVTGTSTWIQPTVPVNPVVGNTYPLTITNGIEYDVRLTSFGLSCGPKSTTLQIKTGSGICCPVGYTLSADSSYCYKYEDTAATPPSSSENCVAVQYNDYTIWGTLIFNPGWNNDGTGTFTQISYTNPFWVNGSGYPSAIGANSSMGPLNRCGVWASSFQNNQLIGFTVCVTVPTDATYYIGTAGDNWPIINIDGTNILTMIPANVGAMASANGYPGVGVEATFRFWFMYPVVLTAGTHVVELQGYNVTSVASLGAEIYSGSIASIASASSYGALGSQLIFSTKNYVGMPIQEGNLGVGYTCPAGYYLVLCQGPAFCQQLVTTPTIAC